MTTLMVKAPFRRARVAALILSCVGLVLAASGSALSAQTLSGPASREAPVDALARNMRVLAGSPKNFDALIGAGRAALALGDTQAAAGFFGRAEEVHASSPLPHIGMGGALLADGDALGALAYFERARLLGANAALMGKDRGLAYDLLGRHGEAQADYRAALFGADPDEARRRLALSLAITGNKDAALAELAPLMARGDAAGARCRALVLALSGDAAGARRFVDAAMPGTSAIMDPFLRRLPSLSSGQKAAAVNLGIFPNDIGAATAAQVSTAPVSGDRLASVEQLLRTPVQTSVPAARPPAAQPIVAPRPATVALPVSARPSVAGVPTTHGARAKIWLQLASGPHAGALPAQFERIKRRNSNLLDGISGYVAEASGNARLLIGPFRNSEDAQSFAKDLQRARVDAFSWTNPPGQPIRKLTVE